jgi:hypothetical protein
VVGPSRVRRAAVVCRAPHGNPLARDLRVVPVGELEVTQSALAKDCTDSLKSGERVFVPPSAVDPWSEREFGSAHACRIGRLAAQRGLVRR